MSAHAIKKLIVGAVAMGLLSPPLPLPGYQIERASAEPAIHAATMVGGQPAAARARVLGVLLRSNEASVNGTPAIEGDTIVVGNTVSTARGGGALVRLPAAAQVTLAGETTVRFSSDAKRLVVHMSSGATLTEETGEQSLSIETPEYRVEPAGPGNAAYLVAMLADRKTEVAARSGNVRITDLRSGVDYLLKPGQLAEITNEGSGGPGQEQEGSKPAPGLPAGQAPATPAPKPKSHTGIVILAGAAAAAVGAAVGLSSGGGGGAPPSSPFRP